MVAIVVQQSYFNIIILTTANFINITEHCKLYFIIYFYNTFNIFLESTKSSLVDHLLNSPTAHGKRESMKSRLFDNGPGEFDMLIGFFVMNGACIG